MSVFIGYPSFMAYQMMKGKKGNNDGFPSIPGTIARYSALGLTNEQMAANPVWVDKTGNGHDLQMKNFFWGGMSGVGGYVQNFNNFKNNTIVDKVRIDEQSSNSIKITILTTGISNAIYIPKNIYQFNKSYSIKISSEGYNEGDLSLSFYATSVSTATTVKVPLNPNGITEIPAIKEDDFLAVYLNVGGKVGSITIEQLPLYPGFILGDGVDDFAVTEKELNFEDTYTVYTAFIPFQVDPVRAMEMCGKDFKKDFYLYYSNAHVVYYTSGLNNYIPVRINQFHIIVCKRNKTNAVIKNLITGETKTFSVSELIDNLGVYYLWRYQRSGTSTAKTAIAGQTICNGYFSTDEDDEKVLDWYKKQMPWLFPDQAWTVTGKTNEDEDRATIANITGNGNNLVLSNFGFAEGSGYGLYQQNYAIWNKVSNRATFTVTSSKIHVTSVTAEEHADFIYTTGQQLKQKIRITGLPEGVSFVIGRSGVNLKIISQDGIYDVDILDDSSANPIIGYRINRIIDSCDITIEQIPEYEGYLVTDGVNDKITSSTFEMGNDWTVIGDWELINTGKNDNAGIVKFDSIVIYNYNPILINIKNGRNNLIPDQNTVNAICSDGRIYSKDWKESIYNEETESTSKNLLTIGYSGNSYTKIALKNLAIYPTVLSREDCIKAYNYLQTLKAK